MSADILRRAAAAIRSDHADEFMLAVADWLDWLAPFARFGKDDPFVVKHALAVARAYLGESA